MRSNYLEDKYLRHIFDNIQDGIIIMDETRKIMSLNPAAYELTGWNRHDYVPYCSYCEVRSFKQGENRCYLIAHDEVPYFLSEMPSYHGKNLNVEMSTALIFQDENTNKKEYLLVLRDRSLNTTDEQVKLSKQMIQMLIEAKESEHQRLAQELHDGVGQSLYSIAVALQAVESFVDDDTLINYISDVRKELNIVMNDVKAYSYELRPQTLDQLGLVATIRDMMTRLEGNYNDIKFEFVTNVEVMLSNTIKINLYRVIQEAVLNSLKYAEAYKIYVELMDLDDRLQLKITDDGQGFNVKTQQHTGLGLKHMKERIYQVGGMITIDSIKGRGTIISASIPKGVDFYDKSNGR